MTGKQRAPMSLAQAIISMMALILLLTGVSAVGDQNAALQNAPIRSSSPIEFDSLPLAPEKRKTVKDSVESADYIQAEELLVKEIEHQPKSYALLTCLGRIFFLDGKYLNCAIAMKKAERNAPLEVADRYTLALAYVVLKKPDWARAEFEKLEHSEPHDPLYIYWQGRIDYDSVRLKAAAAEFERALALDPKYMKAYDNLGLTYEALGDFDGAVKNYDHATQLNRQQQIPSPWPPLNFGALLIKLGKLGEAENNLRESLRYDPRFPSAHYQLGRLLEKENKDEDALQELRLAVSYDSEYPEPHYAMGQIYQRTGEKEQAESEWKIFQKLKQKHPHERTN